MGSCFSKEAKAKKNAEKSNRSSISSKWATSSLRISESISNYGPGPIVPIYDEDARNQPLLHQRNEEQNAERNPEQNDEQNAEQNAAGEAGEAGNHLVVVVAEAHEALNRAIRDVIFGGPQLEPQG